MVGGEGALLDQELECAQAATARLHRERTRLLERSDDQVLQQPLGCDIRGEGGDPCVTVGFAHIVLRQRQVLDLHGLDHRSYSIRNKRNRSDGHASLLIKLKKPKAPSPPFDDREESLARVRR